MLLMLSDLRDAVKDIIRDWTEGEEGDERILDTVYHGYQSVFPDQVMRDLEKVKFRTFLLSHAHGGRIGSHSSEVPRRSAQRAVDQGKESWIGTSNVIAGMAWDSSL